MEEIIQYVPPHPGEILKDFYLDPMGLSITDAASKLAISRPNLSMIINGRTGISAIMALKLAKALGTTPNLWLNMQMNYDLWHASQNVDATKGVKLIEG